MVGRTLDIRKKKKEKKKHSLLHSQLPKMTLFTDQSEECLLEMFEFLVILFCFVLFF